MKQGYLALTIPLLTTALVGTAHADVCTAKGYDTLVPDPKTVLDNKRIITDDGQSKEDHCSNGNLFKVGNPAKPIVDPRAFRGTWSSPEPGRVTYHYTVGGNTSYTFALYQDDSGNLCWQNPNGQIQATAAKPGGFTESCTP